MVSIWHGREVQAASRNADLAHAIATAPTGMPLDQAFTTDITGSSTKLLDSTTVPKSIAQITPEEPNQVGAIWSRKSAGNQRNQFNLTQKMEMGFWLYFGDRGEAAGEGMAFVVQNSAQGDHALAGSGQSLGVWGHVMSNQKGLAQQIAQTAIQNSWALEFDTHVDADIHELAGYFDGAQATHKTPHIAYASPADPSYYLWTPELTNGSWANNYVLRHYHANPLHHGADGTWHHLTMSWDPNSRYLTYYYDDRDPATNAEREIFDSDTFRVKPEDVATGSDQDKAYWGITGATGPNNQANNLVMIDHASSLGKVTADVHLDDETMKQSVTAETTVAAGDQLTYRYEFDYQPTDDEQELQPLTMTMPVPEGLDVTGGQISYSDQKTEKIAKPQGEQIQVKWSQGLSKQRHHATVKVTGKALPTRQPVTRPAAVAQFYGGNYQTTLTAPAYKVAGGLYLKLTNLGDDMYLVKRDGTATVKVRLQNGDIPLEPAIVDQYPLQLKLNGKPHALTEFAGGVVASEVPGTYQIQIPASRLQEGENDLRLQAVGHQSTSNEVAISLVRSPGTLSFEHVPQAASFEAHVLDGRRQLLRRHDDWQLGVRDERGPEKNWRLQVKVTDEFMTMTGQKLSGRPLLMTAKGYQPLDQNDVTVAEKPNRTQDEVFWVDRTWTADTGILLEVAADAIGGDYSGTLQWSLEDVPDLDNG